MKFSLNLNTATVNKYIFPFSRHKDVWRREGVKPLILKFCTVRGLVFTFTLRPLYLGKGAIIVYKAGWAPVPVWTLQKRKIS